MPQVSTKPVYLFDIYGVVDVFSSNSNSAIEGFVDGLKAGRIKLLESVGKELEVIMPDASKRLKALRIRKKEIEATSDHFAMQQLLMDEHGVGIFGGAPTVGHFESVAVARVENLTLVSSNKGFKECSKIIAKCNLDAPKLISVKEFASLI